MQIEHERFDSDEQCNDLIEEFCFKDSEVLYSADTRKRKSVLLQILNDIGYCIGLHGVFRKMELSVVQGEVLGKEVAPLIAPATLYCTAIDMMARVFNKRQAGMGENKVFFTDCARKYFALSEKQADKLWEFRNGIVHQYSIKEFVIKRLGDSNGIIEILNSGTKVISTRPMYSSLQAAIRIFSDELKAEAKDLKKETCLFIEKYGFIYYLVD